MIQINLVPDVKLELLRAQRQRNIVISVAVVASLITVGLVVVTSIYVFGIQAFRDSEADRVIDKEYQALRNIEDLDKTVTIQSQLARIDKTHNEKLLTSRVLSILGAASSKGTENSVSISTFSVTKSEGTISLTAQTDSRGFEAADIFKKNIEAMQVVYKPYQEDGSVPKSKESQETIKFASEVELSNLGTIQEDSGSGESVGFTLSFKYAPEVFNMNNHIESIRGLEKGNVTDSYVRLPHNLFKEARRTTDDRGGQQ